MIYSIILFYSEGRAGPVVRGFVYELSNLSSTPGSAINFLDLFHPSSKTKLKVVLPS